MGIRGEVIGVLGKNFQGRSPGNLGARTMLRKELPRLFNNAGWQNGSICTGRGCANHTALSFWLVILLTQSAEPHGLNTC